MSTPLADRPARCAIYTRRSVGYAEEHEFNSLEAQRAICSSFIASQRPKGWVELPTRYDDLGQTGANLSRTGLQSLLTDIESGLIDIVVIYKLDRITRTLLDFVRLMDLFQQFDVKFVSVTQNFDTGDSTGRLILNILLTFAQFEREISSDRLRDKFHAMKQRGMFIGGHPPYGFDLVDKRLVPNAQEASLVRQAFELYLTMKSFVKVSRELDRLGARRRDRISKRGNYIRGRGICTSSVFNMLGNPIYVGDVRYHGEIYPGQHRGIVSRELWDEVQALRARRTRAKVVEKYPLDLLRGLIFDAHGRSVGVFRDIRHKTRTRYYRSNQSEWGRRNGVRCYRTRADDLDALVISALSSLIADRERLRPLLITSGIHGKNLGTLSVAGAAAGRRLERLSARAAQAAVRAIIERIDLGDEQIQLVVRPRAIAEFIAWSGEGLFRRSAQCTQSERTELLEIATSTVRVKRDLTRLLEGCAPKPCGKPRKHLVSLIRRARKAQQMLDDRYQGSITELAKSLSCTHSRLPRLVRLNYLAPDIIAAILDGTQPADLTGSRLMSTDLPMDWGLQRRLLGFADQPDAIRGAPGW